jgi:hypothetical protein
MLVVIVGVPYVNPFAIPKADGPLKVPVLGTGPEGVVPGVVVVGGVMMKNCWPPYVNSFLPTSMPGPSFV